MPVYETVNTPAITKSDVKLQANPAYGTSGGVVMDGNPAYQSCNWSIYIYIHCSN